MRCYLQRLRFVKWAKLLFFSYFRALGLDATFSGLEDPDEEQTNHNNDSPFARLMDGTCS